MSRGKFRHGYQASLPCAEDTNNELYITIGGRIKKKIKADGREQAAIEVTIPLWRAGSSKVQRLQKR
jgi:hypothetical protein